MNQQPSQQELREKIAAYVYEKAGQDWDECYEAAENVLSLIQEEKQRWIQEKVEKLKKYQCDFNWDFEKEKEKHKSYIALDDVLKELGE